MIYHRVRQFISLDSLNMFLEKDMPKYFEYVDLKVNTYEQGGALYTLIYRFEDE